MKIIENSLMQFLFLSIKSMHYLVNEKNPSYNLRLCRKKFSRKLGYDICVTQLKGKSIYPEFSAEEIISNDMLLREFSQKDIVEITKIAVEIQRNKINSTYSVCEIPLRKKTDNEYVVQQAGKSECQLITSSTIAANPMILQKFSPIDAYNFGYSNGIIEMRELNLQMKEAKQKSQRKAHVFKKIKKLFLIK
jgi:hypothetical protein